MTIPGPSVSTVIIHRTGIISAETAAPFATSLSGCYSMPGAISCGEISNTSRICGITAHPRGSQDNTRAKSRDPIDTIQQEESKECKHGFRSLALVACVLGTFRLKICHRNATISSLSTSCLSPHREQSSVSSCSGTARISRTREGLTACNCSDADSNCPTRAASFEMQANSHGLGSP